MESVKENVYSGLVWLEAKKIMHVDSYAKQTGRSCKRCLSTMILKGSRMVYSYTRETRNFTRLKAREIVRISTKRA